MAKRTIIFRADGGPVIGMGHFTRTLALAEMLKEQFHCIFATCQPSEYQVAEIEKVCHSRIDLAEDDSHFEGFLSLLKGDEIVVLDNYYFTTEYQKSVKAKGGRVVCIDDLHDKHFVADVVINHAPGVDASAYSKEPNTRLLLGFEYALLRKDFLQNSEEKIKKYELMIMIGGADPANISEKIIQSFVEQEYNGQIALIKNHDPGRMRVPDHVKLFQNLSASEVCHLMHKSTLGIFPSSTTAIEACAARLPFITGYFVDNQKSIYHALVEHELAFGIGDLQSCSGKAIVSRAIGLIGNQQKLSSIREKQRQALDQKSKQRIQQVFLNL